MNYIIREFKQSFPESCENFGGKDLEAFNKKMDSLINGKSCDAYGFVEYLGSADILPHIHSLKQKATKKKPFSFERLSLVMLPIFRFFELKKMGNEGELAKIEKALAQWVKILQSHPGISVNTKFEG